MRRRKRSLETLDMVARRYGVLPHVLLEIGFPEMMLDVNCAIVGYKGDKPQPVVMVKGKR